jgi:hypothetical protein
MDKHPYETTRMFQKRLAVYQRALKGGESAEHALKYANIWANITYLSCTYDQGLTQTAMKYRPDA